LGEFSPIGRLFALGNLVHVTEIAKIIEQLFSTVKVVYLFLPEMDWATFWGAFSLTHLVIEELQTRTKMKIDKFGVFSTINHS
jgi:hypothetical protein